MRAEHPQITLLDEGLYCLGIQVGLVVINVGDILPRQQRVDLLIIKACQTHVIAGILQVQQQRGQRLILPFANSLVQRDIECFLILRMQVQTFDNAGIMTYNKGLVITLPDGSEFQVTIVQSR
jgi:hypothetical protein